MPEYLAPGVFVEETSFRSKSIEGVSTTTTGFVGPTRYGPIDLDPEVITSLGDYERVYGDGQQLIFGGVAMHNYMWHAARTFFEEGGKRLYISRIFRKDDDDEGWASTLIPKTATTANSAVRVRARFPGGQGEMRVRLTLRLGQNLLAMEPVPGKADEFRQSVKSLTDGDVVYIAGQSGTPPAPSGEYYLAVAETDATTKEVSWRFEHKTGESASVKKIASVSFKQTGTGSAKSWTAQTGSGAAGTDALAPTDSVRVVTVTVTVLPAGDMPPTVFEGLPLHPRHKRGGEPDSIFDLLALQPASAEMARRLPIAIEIGDGLKGSMDGRAFLQLLFNYKTEVQQGLEKAASSDMERSIDLLLKGGKDGQRPGAAEYEGSVTSDNKKSGLKLFEDIEDISIVAAPGSTFGYSANDGALLATIAALVNHATRMRYRIAVLDSCNGQSISEVLNLRGKLDSSYAALYYPWIKVQDPLTRSEIDLPPSGFVAGIYARNDTTRGVYKAPANEVVNLAVGFETFVNKSQQEVLNPEGVNCFRFFEGRGFRLWGARTVSSDQEWKYVNLRRYFAYLEHSLDRGTQWAVFEPNGEALWANVARSIQDFMFNEWQSGALLGDKPEKAFFVRCDRSTMTQNDLDNGRLVCLIGLAPLRPAEFVILRIGQWTADRR